MFREVTLQVMSARRGLLLMGAVAALAAAGCGGNTPSASSSNGGSGNNSPSNNPYGSPPSSPPDGGSPTAANIGMGSSPTLGNYLVNSADGRTLYYFGLDLPGSGSQAPVSNCTGSCVAVWPIFHVDTPSPSATDLSASDFGELTRSDGTKQTTFRGWPLYEFSGDSKAGDTNGDNLQVWYVIRDPFYSALNMTKNGTAIYQADPAGRTVYTFKQDTVGTASTPPVSNCTGSCLTSWPVFLANGTVVPTGVDPSKLTTFTRTDGTKQSAFDGHPLYYFAGDAVPGDQKGNGFMGVWDIVDPTTL
jgi:predicted lipoprotein with Yx(FWY)xxD motif